MKKITTLLMVLIASVVVAQTTKPKSPADIFIGRTTESYEKAISDANASYQKSIAPVLKRYGGFRDRKILAAGNMAIKRLEAAARGASELDKIRMEQEIEKIRNSLDEKVGSAPKVAHKASVPEVCGIKYKGHYYLAIYGSIPWKKADALCKKMGGHLAYVETAGEMKALTAIFHGKERKVNFWIGATRTGKVWRWGNGKLANTELWAHHDSDPRATCARFRGGGDLTNSRGDYMHQLIGFICEWE